jgi:metaxin
MASAISIPAPILSLFQKFPLHTYPPILTDSARRSNGASSSSLATLLIHPPKPDIVLPSTNLLSQDVESLKWQAYIALRLSHRRAAAETGVPADSVVSVRWDVAEEGGVDGRLPSLQTNDRKLLGARSIPEWADKILGEDAADPLEGYVDENARDESRAWVSLLEGVVHAALVRSLPTIPSHNVLRNPDRFRS